MTRMTESLNDGAAMNERLADLLTKGGRHTPRFLFVSGIGIVAISILTWFGILDGPALLLFSLGAVLVLLASVQGLVVRPLAQQKKGILAYVLSSIFVLIASVVFVFLWQGIAPLAFLISVAIPLNAIRTAAARKYIPWFVILAVLIGAGVIAAEYIAAAVMRLERVQFNSSASIAGLAFLLATGFLLFTVTIITQNRNFRSLQGLLLASFVVIVTIPTVMATILSGVGAYANSQTQTFNTLKAIAGLKENQITLLIDEIRNDADKIQSNADFKQNLLAVINPKDGVPGQSSQNLSRARSFLIALQKEGDAYTEIMVLDNQGNVVVSTDAQNEGRNYETQLFYRQGTVKFFTGFATIPDFGEQNLIVATPLFDNNGQIIRGVIALRLDANAVKRIMESTPGFVEAETYLVDKNFAPVTNTRTRTQSVRSQAALSAIIDNIDGQGTYENYANESVLGYYKWYEPMQMAVIAEVPVNIVVASSVKSLAGSSLLALFVIIVAIWAVAISAKSISDPIRDLVQITESFTAGKYSSRAMVNRKDEIGALAGSFNQMAEQLQDIIGKLEQRVSDRTKELENQTLRVRVAAEIARDAASAPDLHKLLDSSAELIFERFGFYHTGIYLIDKSKEYAVLTASPTEAGKEMIANGYKIRVGDVNIVGRVAASMEPRIILDMDSKNQLMNNPLLSLTRAEMALPLKAGNRMIGVLDVQSDKPQAFSQDDIAAMQVMADQLAIAIERARLLEEVEQNLKELETAYGQYTREGWQGLGSRGILINRGYRFNNIRIEPIKEMPAMGNWQDKDSAKNSGNTIAIPIKLRGQQIGMISAKLKEGHNSRTISTLQAATERLAAALESARLYEEARTRADREQSISKVATAISSSTDYDEILRTTVREVGSALSDTEVSIQILENIDEQKIGS